MSEISIKHSLFGLLPRDEWTNAKRHISALVKGGKVVQKFWVDRVIQRCQY